MTRSLDATKTMARRDVRHLIHPHTRARQHAEQGPLVIDYAKGVFLRDNEGREYLDAMAGQWNVNVGYGRPEIAEAAKAQLERLPFGTVFFGTSHEPAIELADTLARLMPGDLNRFYFTSGGSEANETAIKLARLYWSLKGKPGKTKILSLQRGYHGMTLGALSATGMPEYHQPFGVPLQGFVKAPVPHRFRCAFCREEPCCTMGCVQAFTSIAGAEGVASIAAFIMEPVLGSGGLIIPPTEFTSAVRRFCRDHDILFIADEIITGFGRVGEWTASARWEIAPDLLTFGKGITSGYLPLAGVAVSDRIVSDLETLDYVFAHGFTNSGHPACCAAALANLEILRREKLADNAADVGGYLLERLQTLQADPHVGEVRGAGLLCGIELVKQKEPTAFFPPGSNPSVTVRDRARGEELIVRALGDVIALSPPLTLTRAEADQIVERMSRALTAARDDLRQLTAVVSKR